MSLQRELLAKEKQFELFLSRPAVKGRRITRFEKLFGEALPLEEEARRHDVLFYYSQYGEWADLFASDDNALYSAIYLCTKGANPRRLMKRIIWLCNAQKYSTWEMIMGDNVSPSDANQLLQILKRARGIISQLPISDEKTIVFFGIEADCITAAANKLSELEAFLKQALEIARTSKREQFLNTLLVFLVDYVQKSTGKCYDERVCAIANFARRAAGLNDWTLEAYRKRLFRMRSKVRKSLLAGSYGSHGI